MDGLEYLGEEMRAYRAERGLLNRAAGAIRKLDVTHLRQRNRDHAPFYLQLIQGISSCR